MALSHKRSGVSIRNALVILGAALFVGSRIVIEVLRVNGAAQNNPTLALTYVVNTGIALIAVFLFATLLGRYSDAETVKRHSVLTERFPDSHVFAAGKDRPTISALTQLDPNGDPSLKRASLKSFYFAFEANNAGFNLWVGGSEPVCVLSEKWDRVVSIRTVKVQRTWRTHTALALSIWRSEAAEPLLLPMVLSIPNGATVHPLTDEELESVEDTLHTLFQQR